MHVYAVNGADEVDGDDEEDYSESEGESGNDSDSSPNKKKRKTGDSKGDKKTKAMKKKAKMKEMQKNANKVKPLSVLLAESLPHLRSRLDCIALSEDVYLWPVSIYEGSSLGRVTWTNGGF